MNRLEDLNRNFISKEDEEGFTLIEMVVAVVIFGMLTVLVFNLFSTSRTTTTNVQAGSTSIAEAQIATTQLAKKLRNATNAKVTDDGNRLDVENFDGTCTTWAYKDGILYYHDKGKADPFSQDWTKRITDVVSSTGDRFFTPVIGGVSYSFKSGEAVGTKKIEGTVYMRIPSTSSTSVCFGDAPPATTPSPTPTPTPTPTPVYTISYELSGGLATENPTSYTSKYAAFTLKNPSREGYTFAGWTGTDITGSSTEVTISAGSTGNRSYIATWTPKSFNLTYDLAGGTVSGNPASYTVESGNFTLKNPTRSGYNFTGWMGTDISGSSGSVTVNTGSTGDRSYVATWAGAPTPTPTPTPSAQFEGRWVKTNAWGGTVQGNFSYVNKSGAAVKSVTVKMKVPGATGISGSNLSCNYQGNNEFICQSPSWGTIANGSTSQDYYVQFTGSSFGSNGDPAVQFLSIVKNS